MVRTVVRSILETVFILAGIWAMAGEPQQASSGPGKLTASGQAASAPPPVPAWGRFPEDLHSSDPSLRAGALCRLMDGHWDVDKRHVELIAAYVHDPEYRPRATAVLLLSRIQDSSVVPPLKEAAKDSDGYIRDVATLGLMRNGDLPAVAEIRRLMEAERGNYPLGEISAGVVVSRARSSPPSHRARMPSCSSCACNVRPNPEWSTRTGPSIGWASRYGDTRRPPMFCWRRWMARPGPHRTPAAVNLPETSSAVRGPPCFLACTKPWGARTASCVPMRPMPAAPWVIAVRSRI